MSRSSRRVLLALSSGALALFLLAPRRRRSESPFLPSTLLRSLPVSHDTKLITLALPKNYPLPPGIWSIFVKDPDIQVERPYTPLEGVDQHGNVLLWVKTYEHGQVARWLHSRNVGDTVEIRGPVQTCPSLQDGPWDEVLMISGGTGIAPFCQLLHSTFTSSDAPVAARFTLLHASSSLADLPPPTVLQSLSTLSHKHPDRFRFRLFADTANDPSHTNVCRGRIGKSAIQDALQLSQSTPWWRTMFGSASPAPHKRLLVLVCGPERMINAIAGPYGRNFSQGQVGGILAELGLQSHQVWKF